MLLKQIYKQHKSYANNAAFVLFLGSVLIGVF